MFNIQLNPNERTGGKSDVREADGDVVSDADVHVSFHVFCLLPRLPMTVL